MLCLGGFRWRVHMFSMNLHLPNPEKNRIQAKQTDQRENDKAPFAKPKRVPFIERKKNIGGIFVNQHVKEYVRYSPNEATEINRLERIFHLFWKKSEKLINTEDVFLEPSLDYINHKAQDNWIDC